ncbi:MAG: SET domain-containing protein [Pseudomonadota bacterium]
MTVRSGFVKQGPDTMGWLIDYEVRPSRIHGLGLFTRQPIKQGEKIWLFDRSMNASGPAELGALEPSELSDILLGGYFHFTSQRFVWSIGDMRFMNHAEGRMANIGIREWTALDEDHSMALRDIAPGEELFEDYEFFSIFNLPMDHWLRALYADFCPEQYDFMLDVRNRRSAFRETG